jgi:signal transduction histidine kinase/DNA-binding response OmpR family regulator
VTYSVLAVDDNTAQRYTVSRILRSAGFRVTECGSAREALDLVNDRPDLVVLDVQLPDGSGYEVCRRIKENAKTAAIPVLQISGVYVGSEHRVAGLEGGADAYLEQPIEAAELLAVVRSLLRSRQLEREREELLMREREARAEAERAEAKLGELLHAEQAARTSAMRATERIERLQALTSALSESAAFSDVAAVILDLGVATCGAQSGLLVLRGPSADGRTTVLGGSGGETAAAEDSANAADGPLAAALRKQVIALIDDVAEYPLARAAGRDEDDWLAGAGARAAIPLTARGTVLGALALRFAEPQRFHDEDRTFLQLAAQQCAQAIERARLLDDARSAVRGREELLAIVSHDLRNPLTSIFARAELVRMRADLQGASEIRAEAEHILRAGDRMRRLLGDLLDSAQLDQGRLSLEWQTFDAGSLIAELVDQLGPLAAGQQLQLRSACARPLTCHADRERTVQVLTNLVENAIRFTPAGGSVEVSAEASGPWIRFGVQDSGVGIPAEQIEHVFGRYWQAEKGNGGGVGLGLHIARGIAEAHGGRIWVESPVGGGARFLFELPAAPSQGG